YGVEQTDVPTADFILNYFLNQWVEDISDANLDAALPQIRCRLKFVPENQLELGRQLRRLSPTEREAVANWNPARFRLQANEYNTALVVRWIKDRNWQVTADNLALAIGQKTLVGHLQWEKARSQRPESHHKDDGSMRFSGDFLGKDVNKSTWLRRKEEREAREQAAQAAPQRSQEPDAWTQICQQLMQHGTHSQKAAQKALYERGLAEGKSPRQIASEMETLKRSYEHLVSRAPF